VKKTFGLLLLLSSSFLAAHSQQVYYNLVPQATVESRLNKYGGKDSEREATLKQMFADAGCDDQHISEQAVKHSRLSNVICVLPGTSDKVIIVGAHFDHITQGSGVVDNWSGASLLPSLYQALKDQSRKHTFIFISFTDEEKGEVGSHFYVQQMTKEQVAATDAMVNMDTLGLAPTEIWMNHSDQELIRMAGRVAKATNLPLNGMNVDQVGSSDSEQFVKRNIPRITFHSLTQQTWDANILHTKKDQISQINLNDYYQSYCLITAYLAYIDEAYAKSDASSAK
jgi:Zn-dependent M28 family amino/carboxypeptidase